MDITEAFNCAVASISPGTVVASPYFDMLDGARAVEMGNKRLDTGLIELKECDMTFASSKGQNLAVVAALMNLVVVLYMTWLEGLSLLVTVLSNRYVLDFLENYMKNPTLSVGFTNLRLGSTVGDTFEDKLVNIVLRAFVLGMCKHMGFCRSVGVSVLYDEEDLITRTMDLELLTEVPVESAVQELDKAEQWLTEQNQDANLEVCAHFLQLARHLVRLENVLQVRLHVFSATSLDLPYIDAAVDAVAKIAQIQHVDLPEGSISRFVQLDCNNKHIPAEIVSISADEAYSKLTTMLTSIQKFVGQLVRVRHVGQLETLLKYTLEHELPRGGVIARAIFQLFFIRDDKSIAGLAESVGGITMRLMERISLCGSTLTNPDEWQIRPPTEKGSQAATLKEGHKGSQISQTQGQSADQSMENLRNDCLSKVSRLLDDLESAAYQKFSLAGHNRCRQRQLNNRSIVAWDLLQYMAEQTEVELFSLGVGDRLFPGSEEGALGISSYVYLQKMETMVDVALSGFEQDLYKPHETLHMWWLAGYVAQLSYTHLVGRVRQTNTGKISAVESLAKKIKKTKAGPTKEALRRSLRRWEEHVPQLNLNVAVIDQYLAPAQYALAAVCTAVSHTVQLLQSVAGGVAVPESLVDAETLYNLRMKPWSSVGVPEMPTYAHYCRQMAAYSVSDAAGVKTLAASVKERLVVAQRLCMNMAGVASKSEIADEVCFAGGHKDVEAWFQALQKTCVVYQVELGRMTKMEGKLRLERRDGYHPYFPVYSLAKVE